MKATDSKSARERSLKVTIVGGYGYGNTGDEAQLAANIDLWTEVRPTVGIVVLSPNPGYTASHHGVTSETASRVLLFNSGNKSHYHKSDRVFVFQFWKTWLRLTAAAKMMRAGFPPLFASGKEIAFLKRLQSSDVLHVSGGGFLTGMTRSRLWDTCLVMQLCRHLGTPYFLTGQTIGIFRTWADRFLAKEALSEALAISLRDPEQSVIELVELGVREDRLTPSFDDALFCGKAPVTALRESLEESGIVPDRPYVCVNYHHWGMDAATRQRTSRRLAELLDEFVEETGSQVLFLPMASVDEEPERGAIRNMRFPASILGYDYDYRLARAAVGGAECVVSFKHHPLVFAMGEGVPAVSVSLDDYYHHKNTGAMTNFDQQAFCLKAAQFYGDAGQEALRDVYRNRESIRRELLAKREAKLTASRDFLAGVVDLLDQS